MNRSDGLVQRKTAGSSNKTGTNTGSSSDAPHHQNQASGGASSTDSVEDNDRVASGYDNDADSKETRLTLMEEVLLLGLKDKEVCMT